MDKGGFLGFGLRHKYPLNLKAGIGNLVNCLKGSDAIIQWVCNQLSLETTLCVIYKYEYGGDYDCHFVIVEDIVDYSGHGQIDGTPGLVMMENEGGKRIWVTGPIAEEVSKYAYEDPDSDNDMKEETGHEHINMDWVTDLTNFT